MPYNWEEILQKKTNKELYKIVIGKTVLSNEAIHFAKAELVRRNFDFENMELNKAAWSLSSLEEEDNYIQRFGRDQSYMSMQFYLLTTAGFVILYLGFIYFYKIEFSIRLLLLFIGIYTSLILSQNFAYKKEQKAKENRRLKIKKLNDKLIDENILSNKNAISEDIIRNKNIQDNGFEILTYLFLVIAILFVFVEIIIPIFEYL